MESSTARRARRLRRSPTLAEATLWRLLRDRRLQALKFRRQVPLGLYVTDFACLEARLVLEIDGGVHVLRRQADQARDAWLDSQGFTVLRFPNEQVFAAPHRIVAEILANLPSPLAEEGGRQRRSDEG